MNIKKIGMFLVGMFLVLWAIIPTPDDVTVISPIILFTGGFELVRRSLK